MCVCAYSNCNMIPFFGGKGYYTVNILGLPKLIKVNNFTWGTFIVHPFGYTQDFPYFFPNFPVR